VTLTDPRTRRAGLSASVLLIFLFYHSFLFLYAVVAWKTAAIGTEKIMWSFIAFQWASLQLRGADCGGRWSAVNRKDWGHDKMRSGVDLRGGSPLVSFDHVIDPHFVNFSSSLYTTISNPNANANPNTNHNPHHIPNPNPYPNRKITLQ